MKLALFFTLFTMNYLFASHDKENIIVESQRSQDKIEDKAIAFTYRTCFTDSKCAQQNLLSFFNEKKDVVERLRTQGLLDLTKYCPSSRLSLTESEKELRVTLWSGDQTIPIEFFNATNAFKKDFMDFSELAYEGKINLIPGMTLETLKFMLQDLSCMINFSIEKHASK